MVIAYECRGRVRKKEKKKDILIRVRPRLWFAVTRNGEGKQQDTSRAREYVQLEKEKWRYLREKTISLLHGRDSRLYLNVIHIYAFKKYKCQTCLYFIHLYTQIPDNKKDSYIFVSTFLSSQVFRKAESLNVCCVRARAHVCVCVCVRVCLCMYVCILILWCVSFVWGSKNLFNIVRRLYTHPRINGKKIFHY